MFINAREKRKAHICRKNSEMTIYLLISYVLLVLVQNLKINQQPLASGKVLHNRIMS